MQGGLFNNHRAWSPSKRALFTPSVPRKGTWPAWTPPLHVYVSQSAAALGGSTRQTRMLSQVEAQLLQLRCPHYPEVFQTYRQKLFIQGQKKTPHLQKKKGTQEIQNRRNTRKKNVPERHEIRSCSICLISNTFTDKRILNLVVHLIPQRWTGFETEGPLVEA